MWRDVKAAYKSWWTQIAMLVSAVAIFSYVVRVLQIGLSGFFTDLLSTYRLIFHPIINFLLSPFPFSLTDWQKDLLLVWFAIGGATCRTFWTEFTTNARLSRDPASIEREDRWGALWLTMVAFVAWPVGWVLRFREPFFYAFKRRDGGYLFLGRWREKPNADENEILADMRVVLLIQMVTVIAAVIVMTAVNAIGV